MANWITLLVGVLSVTSTSFAALHAQEPLPRVLILGDSVYHQPTAELKKQFKGQAEITHPALPDSSPVFNSSTVLDNLKQLLGENPWDLIIFNVGLGDLVHRDGKIKTLRVLPFHAGGIPATDAKTYERNLRELVARLRATESRLAWASSTPIRSSPKRVFKVGSEIEYNDIAAKIMRESKIEIVDMHTHVKGVIDMDKPAAHGADPFHFDRKPIHGPLAEIIGRLVE
ncbi:MAG: SGNH/GDSL hydrolase family protein [Planctomycetota bacterium]|nr:SGNH/GDSL hydrolase family protein [Planctomycetota bacterium]